MTSKSKLNSTAIDGSIRPIQKSEPALDNDHDIEMIGEGVLAGKHPYLNWTHLAHCAATVYLLKQRPDWRLEDEMPTIIRTYNEAIGVANTDRSGYHHTLTIFYIRAIRDFLETTGRGFGLAETVAVLRRSPLGQREYVFEFYSRAHLFSAAARTDWVEPDIKNFSFAERSDSNET